MLVFILINFQTADVQALNALKAQTLMRMRIRIAACCSAAESEV